MAMASQESMDAYLQYMATQDYRDVAPEILEARRELLDILLPLYAKQVESEDQQAMWELTSELMLATLSVVSVSGDVSLVSPEGQFSVDRQQAQQLYSDLKERQAHREKLQQDITGLETDLFKSMMDYADVYYRYVEEWDQLSVMRDRAYLAAHAQDWTAAEAAADLAIQQAPKEREAHLLKAMAIIESGEQERLPEATALLNKFVEDHPGHSAPAFTLLGVAEARAGNTKAAQLHFQQASAYYPRQSDELTDMVNPYKMRSFLRESREGSFIVELYKSTMLGAGYFSPDLQQAKVEFDAGDFEAGRNKVLDHFARRRNQQQWDFVISDIQFCQELLGPDFWTIFPEDTFLDLEVSQTMMGSGLNLSINNGSSRTLKNATLIVVLHLTDMYPGMYEALPAPQTIPTVPAGETTSFGSIDVNLTYGGKEKTVADIVEHRAILVTNEAVVWVDTDEFKLEKAVERSDALKTRPEGPPDLTERFPEFRSTRDSLVAGLSQGMELQIEQKYGSDNVVVQLPKELSILRPVFRLKYGDQVFTAEDNLISGDHIELRFAGVENFDGTTEVTDDLELVMGSPFGDLVLSWESDGALTWNYAGVESPEAPGTGASSAGDRVRRGGAPPK